MSGYRKIVQILMISYLIFSPLLVMFTGNENQSIVMEDNFSENLNSEEQNNLKTSDIAGSDLYAEQISAYVAGSESIIRQSLFTNDTNIFSNFDVNDPAFYKCNVLLSASNGITPGLFPYVLTDNIFGTQFQLSYNSFIGFLYYDEELSSEDAAKKSVRARKIIQRKFDIDLIMVNSSNPNFFPFVGYYPQWDLFFEEVTRNIPMDGYWKALDVERLTSDEYIENNHISTTFLMLNSLDIIQQGLNVSTDQLNFNFNAMDLSYLENMDFEALLDQYSTALAGFAGMQDLLEGFIDPESQSNETVEESDIEMATQALGSFSLSNDSHYTTLMVQYEGLAQGIKALGNNQYEFNLWDAMGYEGSALHPSEKIYIALIGAFMSEIDINILGTEILDATPQYFELYDFMLEQVGLLLFLADVDFDVQSLKDYSFELLWVQEDGIFRNYVRPVNLNDETDPVNQLARYGFQGIPFIPTGILNPIEDLSIKYEVDHAESNIAIRKDLIGDNATFGAYQNFQFNITAENVGNVSVWGVPTPIPIDLEGLFGETLYEAMWNTVNSIYPGQYNSLEDFLNVDEDPRIFYFDTWGLGIIDHYYPDLTNQTNIWPYSPEMANLIDVINSEQPFLLPSLGIDPEQLKSNFTNPSSIWNPDNWELAPGESISYNSTNLSITAFDTYSAFYSYNFTIKETFPELPAIISGSTITPTTSEMALETDNVSWSILSKQFTSDHYELEIDFPFENQTVIDFENNTLERVSLNLNMSLPDGLDTTSYQIFNYTLGDYQDISSNLVSVVNNSYTFTFIKASEDATFDWLFDPSAPDKNRVVFKLLAIDTEQFNVSINDFNVSLAERDINSYEVAGSRVIYTASSGANQFDKSSNTITLGTDNIASINAKSYLSVHNAMVGELNTFTMDFKNIGSEIAHNLSIAILIPGIINDTGDFTLRNNYLYYNLSQLAPSDARTVNFSFYTPNSESLRATVSYQNPEHINNRNSSSLVSYSNEVYFSAPVDYKGRFPYVRTVDVSYNASDNSPAINQNFNMSVNIKNTGPNGIKIPDVNLSMNDQYGDLKRVDSKILNLTDIEYGESDSVKVTLKKDDWKGYYYPPINFLQSSESRTIQIAKATPIVLGDISFKITKSVDQSQIEIGDTITVSIKVKNTGTICVKDFMLSDVISFRQLEFALTEGKLVHEVDCLEPDEEVTFEYKLRGSSQASIALKSASINYYFLWEEEGTSNEVEMKIIIPIWIQSLFVLIPAALAIAVCAIYYWQTHKYKAGKFELQRNELSIYKLTSKAAVLKIEHTLRERLGELANEVLDEGDTSKMKNIKNSPKQHNDGGAKK